MRAFEAVDADKAQRLVVATEGDNVVGTFQLSFIPGMSRRGARFEHNSKPCAYTTDIEVRA